MELVSFYSRCAQCFCLSLGRAKKQTCAHCISLHAVASANTTSTVLQPQTKALDGGPHLYTFTYTYARTNTYRERERERTFMPTSLYKGPTAGDPPVAQLHSHETIEDGVVQGNLAARLEEDLYSGSFLVDF